MESEYLPGVNETIRERFHAALSRTDDLVEYHRELRLLASLLTRPMDVIAELTAAPVRILRRSDH